MKKITLLTIAVLAISFASCKKDRVCTCSTTDVTTGPSGTTTTTSNNTTTYLQVTKKGGRRNCVSAKVNYSYDILGSTYNVESESNCTLSN